MYEANRADESVHRGDGTAKWERNGTLVTRREKTKKQKNDRKHINRLNHTNSDDGQLFIALEPGKSGKHSWLLTNRGGPWRLAVHQSQRLPTHANSRTLAVDGC